MPSRNGASGTVTSSPTKTEQIRERLLAGEQLDNHTVMAEYDTGRGTFSNVVRELKRQGHVFNEVKTSPTEPILYQIAETQSLPVGDQRTDSLQARRQGQRTDSEKLKQAFLAGEHLRAADLPEQGLKPQLLSVTIAQLKQMGYLFDHEDSPDGKLWFVTGKGEPHLKKKPSQNELICPDCGFETSNAGGFGSHMAAHRRGAGEPQPRKKRRSTGAPRSTRTKVSEPRTRNGGSRPKMPAPELDAATDIVLVHRISPDEVEVAFRQGTRQWLVAVRSCIED